MFNLKIAKRVNPYGTGPVSLNESERIERINRMAKTKKPKTYFEQVPLEIVKKIAEMEPPNGGTSTPSHTK
jgi:hypothetical protein